MTDIKMKTPGTLVQAVLNGGIECSFMTARSAQNITAHVNDFVAQKFAVAILEAKTPEEEQKLKLLYETIVGVKNE